MMGYGSAKIGKIAMRLKWSLKTMIEKETMIVRRKLEQMASSFR
jgi:hypothetical protein